jgi:hypothetical protein
MAALALPWVCIAVALVGGVTGAWAAGSITARPTVSPPDIMFTGAPPAPAKQSHAEAYSKSAGCVSCHTATDHATMHRNPAVALGCTDCHGGDAMVQRPTGSDYRGDRMRDYRAALDRAHVMPRYANEWNYPSSATPERSYTLLNRESPEFIRFTNPSDYRVAREACGACHLPIIQAAERSLMATGAMLWNGAAYNNGVLPPEFAFKRGLFGEAYTRDGIGATIVNPVKPDAFLLAKGVLAQLFPLPAWETMPPGDVFRVFERGGRVIQSLFPEIGLPNVLGRLQTLDEPGRPDIRQSVRGPGTGQRIAVPLINITKTRLNDPFTWFLGSNDQPGDYRSSGCASCHAAGKNFFGVTVVTPPATHVPFGAAACESCHAQAQFGNQGHVGHEGPGRPIVAEALEAARKRYPDFTTEPYSVSKQNYMGGSEIIFARDYKATV